MGLTYAEATSWLFKQFPSYQQIGGKAYKPTLSNTLRLIEELNIDLSQLNYIHVAGTNGKGTVCALLASVLRESGYTTGLFSSPHILDYRERIRINGELISEQEVISFVKRIKTLKLDFEPSFFEITFVLAVMYFTRQNADICVIETGLGGRLDATNVIDPIVSIITTIGLEHTNYLGDTREAIAKEKAGIIKPGRPVLLGEQLISLLSVFEGIASENNSPLVLTEKHVTIPFDLPFLKGSYQVENFRTVYKAIDILRNAGFVIPDAAIQLGLDRLTQNSGYSGRLQIMQRTPLVIFDAGHNADGIAASTRTLNETVSGKLHIVFGCSADKDLSAICSVMPENAFYYITSFDHERAASISILKSHFDVANFSDVQYFKDPKIAYNKALNRAEENDGILVIGSFFLLAEFF